MKAKAKVSELASERQGIPSVPNVPPVISECPGRLVSLEDTQKDLPPITQEELLEYGNALLPYQLARADFELRKAVTKRKLLMMCEVEDGKYGVKIKGEDIVLRELCTVCNSVHKPF